MGNNLSIVPLAIMLLVTVGGSVFMGRLALGRRIYAIGGNELAARFSGLQVGRVKLGVYLLSGLTAGIAALLSIGYYGAATSGDGQGYELNVIAAAVVGGVAISGGRGNLWGVLAGVLLMACIAPALVFLKLPPQWEKALQGCIILLAVAADGWRSARGMN